MARSLRNTTNRFNKKRSIGYTTIKKYWIVGSAVSFYFAIKKYWIVGPTGSFLSMMK